jgi:glucose/arabinose dehydrogenase
MTLGAKGTVFVGSMAAGKVYAVVDKDGDQRGDEIHTIAQGLNHPNGTAFKDGSLYVAEINRILRFDKIEENLADPPQPVVVSDSLPHDFHHGWKFIAFGPDGLLYTPVGAPCNVCEPDPNKYAVIKRMRPDGKDLEVFARGEEHGRLSLASANRGTLVYRQRARLARGRSAPGRA